MVFALADAAHSPLERGGQNGEGGREGGSGGGSQGRDRILSFMLGHVAQHGGP